MSDLPFQTIFYSNLEEKFNRFFKITYEVAGKVLKENGHGHLTLLKLENNGELKHSIIIVDYDQYANEDKRQVILEQVNELQKDKKIIVYIVIVRYNNKYTNLHEHIRYNNKYISLTDDELQQDVMQYFYMQKQQVFCINSEIPCDQFFGKIYYYIIYDFNSIYGWFITKTVKNLVEKKLEHIDR